MEFWLLLILSPILVRLIFALIKGILSILYGTTNIFSKDTWDTVKEIYNKSVKFIKESPLRAFLGLILILAVLYGTYKLFLYNPVLAGITVLFWIGLSV